MNRLAEAIRSEFIDIIDKYWDYVFETQIYRYSDIEKICIVGDVREPYMAILECRKKLLQAKYSIYVGKDDFVSARNMYQVMERKLLINKLLDE